ncbi:MAG: hypothetical protein M3P42_01565 [Actinomycetota bacterium]|nr:hypothetical protein [Actinomycetota bacterium]
MIARLAAVAAVSLVLAGAADGGATSMSGMSGWFVLEGGTIACGTELFPHERSYPSLSCWRLRNGFELVMTDRGKAGARTNRYRRGYRPPIRQRLAVGRTVYVARDRSAGTGTPPRDARFYCTARPNWLVCRNRAGYGWRFGRLRGWQLIVHG